MTHVQSSTIGQGDPPADTEARSRCPSCGSYVGTVDVQEAVCRDCDVVVSDAPVSRRRAPMYDHEGRRSRQRTGGRVSPLYTDGGIGVGTPDGVVRGATADIVSGRSSDLRSLARGLGEIARLGAALDVPTVEQESAAVIFRKARATGLLRGRSCDGFAGASLLAAIRNSPARIPVSLEELEDASRCDPSAIRNARGALELHLGIQFPQMNPLDFLPRAVSELALSEQVLETATELVRVYNGDPDAQCRGFSPRTIAGGAIHAACDRRGIDDRPTLSDIAEAVGASAARISERKGYLLNLASSFEE